MKELLELIAEALVDHPEQVVVTEIEGERDDRATSCGSRRRIWAR